MVKKQGKTGLIVTIIALGLTLLIVGGIVIWQNANRQAALDQANQSETSDTDSDKDTTPTDTPAEDAPTSDVPTTPAVDPATLSSVDIEPLSITVYYTKGTPGFEFVVKRTANNTEYVEFSAPELVGTKCTNDAGSFASIIKDVDSTEDASTISQKVTVNGTVYGLSLTSSDCTSDVELLKEYQSAFINGFGQLKEL